MVNIRRFVPGDAKAVKSVITNIMDEEFSDDQAAYPTEDIQDIARTYGGIGEAFFVAEVDGAIVGTIAIKKEDERVALMRRLFVAADQRKKKIGIKLIDRAVQFCDEVGYDELIFKTTSRMKGAIATCQKQGFTQRAKLVLGPIELLKFSRPLKLIASKNS